MKTYDRAQVLQVAAQLYPYFAEQAEVSLDRYGDNCASEAAVGAAIHLIDEVERQCPLPGKPEATIAPSSARSGA